MDNIADDQDCEAVVQHGSLVAQQVRNTQNHAGDGICDQRNGIRNFAKFPVFVVPGRNQCTGINHHGADQSSQQCR